jgi:hypothetical protein
MTVAFAMVAFLLGGYIMSSQGTDTTLRVGFPVRIDSSGFEPTRIILAHEYVFLENVFSPLVEFSKDGAIEPGVAEAFDWIGDELRLSIRKNLKTASGRPITTDDVVFSLKRLLVLSRNTHGNFNDIVCPGVVLKSIDDECPGIRAEAGSIFLRATGGRTFLIPMLAAIDFAIVPRESVDPKTLKIINFAETSGPYWVESVDQATGQAILRLNQHHYHAQKNIAQTVELIPTPKAPNASLQMLKDNALDHVTTIDASRADAQLSFARDNEAIVSVHASQSIALTLAKFTERGLRELSTGERRNIATRLRRVFEQIYEGVPGHEPRREFFPAMSAGGLSKDQQDKLYSLDGLEEKAPIKKLRIAVLRFSNFEQWGTPIAKAFPSDEVYQETTVPTFKKFEKIEDEPHLVVLWTDTAFLEDVGLISYNINAGTFGLTKTARSRWLADYMATEDREIRLKLLKELHFKALSEAVIVPLIASPYVALTRKPWRMELSTLFANNQLWRIKLH